MKMTMKVNIDHIDTVLIDLDLDMDANIVNIYNVSRYDDAYIYQATPKQHLKLSSG